MTTPDPPGATAPTRRPLWDRPRQRWLLGIPLGAFLAFGLGVLATVGGSATLHATSSQAFCADGCHEMATMATREWQASTHFKNARGLKAGCPDCHVPGPLVPLLERKVAALGEGYHHLAGTISTPAKYEARRREMAERVWAYMQASDSRECRHCHDAAAMDVASQGKMAARAHTQLPASGKTCIDCHRGVAHTLPPGVE